MNAGRNFCDVFSLWLPRFAQNSNAYCRILVERRRRDAAGLADDLFEQPLLANAVLRQLVVDDRIDRDRRLGQPVGERLLPGVELR